MGEDGWLGSAVEVVSIAFLGQTGTSVLTTEREDNQILTLTLQWDLTDWTDRLIHRTKTPDLFRRGSLRGSLTYPDPQRASLSCFFQLQKLFLRPIPRG